MSGVISYDDFQEHYCPDREGCKGSVLAAPGEPIGRCPWCNREMVHVDDLDGGVAP